MIHDVALNEDPHGGKEIILRLVLRVIGAGPSVPIHRLDEDPN